MLGALPADVWKSVLGDPALTWHDIRRLKNSSKALSYLATSYLERCRRVTGSSDHLRRLSAPISHQDLNFIAVDFEIHESDFSYVVLRQMKPILHHKFVKVAKATPLANYFPSPYQYALSKPQVGGSCLLSDAGAVVVLEKKIVHLDHSGRLSRIIYNQPQHLKGPLTNWVVATACDGNVLLARPSAEQAGKSEVCVLSSKTFEVLRTFGLAELRDVRAIAIHPLEGDVYVAQPNMLLRYSYEDGSLVDIYTMQNPHPISLDVDASGNCFVVSQEESFVQIYSPTGQLLHTFADMIASPSRVRIRNDGRIAVLAPNISDSNRYSIYLY